MAQKTALSCRHRIFTTGILPGACCVLFLMSVCCACGQYVFVNTPAEVALRDGGSASLPGGTALRFMGMREGFYMAYSPGVTNKVYMIPESEAELLAVELENEERATAAGMRDMVKLDLDQAVRMFAVAGALAPGNRLYGVLSGFSRALASSLESLGYSRRKFAETDENAEVSVRKANALRNASDMDAAQIDYVGPDGRQVLASQIENKAANSIRTAASRISASYGSVQDILRKMNSLSIKCYDAGRYDVAVGLAMTVKEVSRAYLGNGLAPELDSEQIASARVSWIEAANRCDVARAAMEAHMLVRAREDVRKALDSAARYPDALRLKASIADQLEEIDRDIEKARELASTGRKDEALTLLTVSIQKCVDYEPLTELYAELNQPGKD